mmetsp:Transcript_10615/g.43445  ORF Transcript_10615/g.43445 Transcript_10615/m.43445 type:complete len:370 (-) Transcript_10615:1312-2421(-)
MTCRCAAVDQCMRSPDDRVSGTRAGRPGPCIALMLKAFAAQRGQHAGRRGCPPNSGRAGIQVSARPRPGGAGTGAPLRPSRAPLRARRPRARRRAGRTDPAARPARPSRVGSRRAGPAERPAGPGPPLHRRPVTRPRRGSTRPRVSPSARPARRRAARWRRGRRGLDARPRDEPTGRPPPVGSAPAGREPRQRAARPRPRRWPHRPTAPGPARTAAHRRPQRRAAPHAGPASTASAPAAPAPRAPAAAERPRAGPARSLRRRVRGDVGRCRPRRSRHRRRRRRWPTARRPGVRQAPPDRAAAVGCRPGGSWPWHGPGVGSSWRVRPERHRRWSQRRNPARPAASAVRGRPGRWPGGRRRTSAPGGGPAA